MGTEHHGDSKPRWCVCVCVSTAIDDLNEVRLACAGVCDCVDLPIFAYYTVLTGLACHTYCQFVVKYEMFARTHVNDFHVL